MSVGWKTWSAFALLFGAGLAVFLLLPRWVAERSARPERPLPSEAESPQEPIEAVGSIEPIGPDENDVPPTVELPEQPAPTTAPVEAREEPAPAEAETPSHDAFSEAMTEGLSAMQREDFPAAREAFARALAARPEASEASSGLAQAEESLKNLAIAGHQNRGRELERSESWRAAEAEYDSALAIDSTLLFAREGKQRSAAYAIVQEKLDFQVSHPERLSDARALEEASRLLDEARDVEGGGPKRSGAIDKLEALIQSYSQPIAISFVSDTLTEVTLNRVGRLGKFDRKVLEIRPGRYVAVGTRAGFRDVRVEFTVEPGKPLSPIPVRCEEAI